MDSVYDIPAPEPSPDVVDRHLAINTQHLAKVADAAVQKVDDLLDYNSAALAQVEGRVNKSVSARVSRGTSELQPVVQALQGAVDAGVSANAGILGSLPQGVIDAVTPQSPVGTAALPRSITRGGTSGWGIYITNDHAAYMLWQDQLDNPAPGVLTLLVSGLTQNQAVARIVAATNTTQQVAPGVLIEVQAQPVAAAPPITIAYPGITPVSDMPVAATHTTQLGAACIMGPDSTRYAIMNPWGCVIAYADTQEHATAWVNGTNTPVSAILGPTGAPPPIKLPPTEPVSSPVQVASGYYCTVRVNADSSIDHSTFSADELTIAAGNGFAVESGPYPDKATADAACGVTQVSEPGPQKPFHCSVSSVPIPPWPNWCSVTVCETIDEITRAVKVTGDFDIFALWGAGSQTSIGPAGTWLGDLRSTTLVGEPIYTVISLIGCVINKVVNSAIDLTGQPIAVMGGVALAAGIVDLAEKWLGLGLHDAKMQLDYWLNYYSPAIIPGVSEADDAYLSGVISQDQHRCWVTANNVCYSPHNLILDAQRKRPDWQTAEKLFRAGVIDQDARDTYFHREKITDATTAAHFIAGYTNYPGMGDVVRFMVRDVWDPLVVEAGELDSEFTTKWSADAQKFGYIAGVTDDLARLYWRAHWVYPSTGQVYEMLHRLRPGRVDPDLVFTASDALELLGVNDHAPGYRESLLAISYRPLPIRALRTLYDTDQISDVEVGERYQDMGYGSEDATLFSNQERTLKKRRLASQGRGWTAAAISKAYAAGAMPPDEVKMRMGDLGYPVSLANDLMDVATHDRLEKFAVRAEQRAMSLALSSALTAYDVGSITEEQLASVLRSQGYSDAGIAATIQSAYLKNQAALVKQGITLTRRAVLGGVLSPDEGQLQLVSLGVTSQRATAYVDMWRLQLTSERRRLGGNQVLKMVREGILSEQDAAVRLENLGWQDVDLQLMLATVRYQTAQGESRIKAAQDKQRQKAAAALLREAKLNKLQSDKIAKEICKRTPLSMLQRWYALHLVDDQYVTDSLSCQGYTPDQISNILVESRAKRAARDAKKQTAAAAAAAKVVTDATRGGQTTDSFGAGPSSG